MGLIHGHEFRPPKQSRIKRFLLYLYGRMEPTILRLFNKLLSSKFFTHNRVGRAMIKLVAKMMWFLPYGVVLPYPLVEEIFEEFQKHSKIKAGRCPCKLVYADMYGRDKVEDFDLRTDINFFAGLSASEAYEKKHHSDYIEVDMEWLRKHFELFAKKGLVPTIYACCRSGQWMFVLCNCDKRYCVPLRAYLTWGEGVTKSPFYVEVDRAKCVGCGKCINICPADAMISPGEVDPEKCIGCGICIYHCEGNARRLVVREKYKLPRHAKMLKPFIRHFVKEHLKQPISKWLK